MKLREGQGLVSPITLERIEREICISVDSYLVSTLFTNYDDNAKRKWVASSATGSTDAASDQSKKYRRGW